MAQQKRFSPDVQRRRSCLRRTDPARQFQAVSSETQRRSKLLANGTAMYLYVSTSCKIASLYNGEYSHSESNLFQGDAPSQLIIGFVSSEAFSGNYKKSPFNFQPFDCNLWPCTSTDNRTRPNRNNPTSPEKNYVEVYRTLSAFEATLTCLAQLTVEDTQSTS